MSIIFDRLMRQAEAASNASKMFAQAKSLRNSDGQHNDSYSWAKVDETLEAEAANRIIALENALRHMTDLARSHAAKTGPMHAWWDSIMDAEAILKNQPTLHDWNKS